jgi:hypothetical protein
MRRPWPSRGCSALGEEINVIATIRVMTVNTGALKMKLEVMMMMTMTIMMMMMIMMTTK